MSDDSIMTSPRVWQPHRVETAYEKSRQFASHACYVAGGTLLQVQWEAENRRPEHLVSLERIDTMRDIVENVHGDDIILQIGALTTLNTCSRHPLILKHFPLIAEAARHVASPAVRNRATIGGNIVSGCGDTLPALLVSNAETIWYDGTNYTTLTVNQFLSKMKPSLMQQPPGLLTSIHLKRSVSGRQQVTVFRKIGRREAFTPGLVTVSAVCSQNARQEINDVRLAAGGGDFIPQRLTASERLLEGKVPSQVLWESLHSNIVKEFHPPENVFASIQYRSLVAANLFVSELTRVLDSLRKGGEMDANQP